MSRIKAYLALTVLAGVAAGVWFAATQENTGGENYDLFQAVTVLLAVAAVVLACALFEIARWAWTRLRR